MSKPHAQDKTNTGTEAQKQKSLKPLIALNIVLFCVVLGVVSFVLNPSLFSISNVPHAVPAFGMEGLDGQSFGSADLQNDDIMLVNIFASWCTPCIAEHPFLVDLSQKHGLPVYGIAMQDQREAVEAFLKKHGNPYVKVGMDYASLVPGALNIEGIPASMIIDKNLKIHWLWLGPITQDTMDEHILPLIKTIKSENKNDTASNT